MLNISCLIHFSRLCYVFTPHKNLEKKFKDGGHGGGDR